MGNSLGKTRDLASDLRRPILWLAALASFGVLPASSATLYVSAVSTNPTTPYTTWETASTNIQDAIGVAQPGDLVLVTNGTYAFGGAAVQSVTNRIALTNSITVLSVSGPAQTTIDGS